MHMLTIEEKIQCNKIEVGSRGALDNKETPNDIAAIGSQVKISSNGLFTIGDRITDYDLYNPKSNTTYSNI
jgi:hypothetical protein